MIFQQNKQRYESLDAKLCHFNAVQSIIKTITYRSHNTESMILAIEISQNFMSAKTDAIA